jgi:acetyl-CoA C-acetyltransferase
VALDPRTPVLAGAGQVVVRPDPDLPLGERPEPVELMARALEEAARDCGRSGAGERLLGRAQSLRVMVPLCWSYADPAELVARRLGVDPPEHALTVIGGNGPQTVAAQTAAAIAEGRLDVAVLTGAECLYTLVAARRDPARPELPWTTQPPDTPAPLRLGRERVPVNDTERARGLDRPRNVFPLFENALRAAAGEPIDDHQARVSRWWARFSEVAATNPYAWRRTAYTPEELRTVGDDNRMITFPYPKRMNANDRVDMGAALVLCSLGAARDAGVPDDRLIFPLAAADAHDHWLLSERRDLHSSPAIALAGAAAFEGAGLGLDDVALVDLYSCFPCAVQISAAALGLDLDDPSRPATVTGGLAFAGGPGNNYVTHSLATMAGRLRDEPGTVGLVTGLGWYVTKHAVGLWSSAPGSRPFRHVDAQAQVDATEKRTPAPADLEGDVTVETYTVVHDRQGQAQLGILALLDDAGRRAWGNITDPDSLGQLETDEGCGRKARLKRDGRAELR